MLEHIMNAGAREACKKFCIDPEKLGFQAPVVSAKPWLDKLKNWGMGQANAVTSLGNNLRGGFGGNLHATMGLPEGPMTQEMTKTMQGVHRQGAMGNLKTLAPSLAVAGGAYMLHRHNQAKEDEQRQQHMMPGAF